VVVAATKRLLQLPDRGVEHGAKIGSARLGAHRRTRAPAGDLHSLAYLGQAGIVLVIEHDVIADDAADVTAVALEAGKLLGDVHPVVGGYLEVASRHHDVRCDSNLHIHSDDLHGFVGCPVSVETDLLATDPAFGAGHRDADPACT